MQEASALARLTNPAAPRDGPAVGVGFGVSPAAGGEIFLSLFPLTCIWRVKTGRIRRDERPREIRR